MTSLATVAMYGHHAGGFGGLGSTLAHAAVWSLVGRLVWHAPPVLLLFIGCAALGWFIARGTRRG